MGGVSGSYHIGALCRHPVPRDAAHDGAKRSGGGVDLVVVGTLRESAQLVNKVLIPIALNQLDEAVFALGGEGVGAVFLVALLTLSADGVTTKLTGEIGCLEFAGLSGVLRNPDFRLVAVPARCGLDLVFDLRGAPTTANDIDDVNEVGPRIDTVSRPTL